MRTNEPGPLSEHERELLSALLAHEFDRVEALRAQVPFMQAKRGCECGCGTIDFVTTDHNLTRSSSSSPVPAEGSVMDDADEPIGGLILFLEDGLLGSLEIYSYDEPLPLPDTDRVRWTV